MRKVDKYENVNDESFKRVLGVKRSTYEEMLNEYKKAEEERKPKLCDYILNFCIIILMISIKYFLLMHVNLIFIRK